MALFKLLSFRHWIPFDSIAVSVFVVILVEFDKYRNTNTNTESETSRLVYISFEGKRVS